MNGMNRFFHMMTNLSTSEEEALLILKENKQVIIEQIEHLLSYTSSEITLQTIKGKIEVIGENLFIFLLHGDQVVVQGTVYTINVSNEKEEGQ